MELYIISGLSIIIFAFLISLCVQLIRIERLITDLSYLVESKVTRLLHPDKYSGILLSRNPAFLHKLRHGFTPLAHFAR